MTDLQLSILINSLGVVQPELHLAGALVPPRVQPVCQGGNYGPEAVQGVLAAVEEVQEPIVDKLFDESVA